MSNEAKKKERLWKIGIPQPVTSKKGSIVAKAAPQV